MIRELLTNWAIHYAKKNYHNLNITYDGAYGWSDRLSDRPKVKLSRLVKDFKEDFEIVEWFLLEVIWWDETIVTKNTTNDDSIAVYNLDGTFIKCRPVQNPNQLYYSEWVWEYYTPVSDSWDNILQHYKDKKATTLTVDKLIEFLKDHYNVPTIKK